MKNKKLISIIIGLLLFWQLPAPTLAQNAMVWQKCFGSPHGNGFKNMCKTTDGGYLLVGDFMIAGGDFNGFYGDVDIGLIKIDSNGNKIWSTHYGSEGKEDALTILKGYNNRYYIIGVTNYYGYPNFHGFPEAIQKMDGYVLCIDENGSIIWQHCYGGYGIDWLYSGVVMDSSFLYVAGNTVKSNGGETGGNYDPDTSALATYDMFVCKIRASNGSVVHSKRFGGTENEEFNQMIVTGDNNLLLLGKSQSDDFDVPVNYGDNDAWVLKIDTSFNIITSKIWGGVKNDAFYDAVNLPNGDYVLFGYTKNSDTAVGNLNVTISSGDQQMLLIKTNNSFIPKWQKTYGCAYSDQQYLGSRSFVQTADKGFIMGARAQAGPSCHPYPYTIGNSVFIKTDSSGNQLYENYYGSGGPGAADVVRSILVTGNGGIIVGSIGHADANNSCNSPGVDSTRFWNIYKLDNTLGIDQNENSKEYLRIYPNPTSTIINISTQRFETDTKLNLQIFNIQGKLVRHVIAKKNNDDIMIDVRDLQNGLYVGRLMDDDGEGVSFKFVKE